MRDLRTWFFKNGAKPFVLRQINTGEYSSIPKYIRAACEPVIEKGGYILPNGMYIADSLVPGAQKGLFCLYDVPSNVELGEYTGNWVRASELNVWKQKDPLLLSKKLKYVWPMYDLNKTDPVWYIDPTDDTGEMTNKSHFLAFINEPHPRARANAFPHTSYLGQSLAKKAVQTVVTCREVKKHHEFYMHYGNEYDRDYPVGAACVNLPSFRTTVNLITFIENPNMDRGGEPEDDEDNREVKSDIVESRPARDSSQTTFQKALSLFDTPPEKVASHTGKSRPQSCPQSHQQSPCSKGNHPRVDKKTPDDADVNLKVSDQTQNYGQTLKPTSKIVRLEVVRFDVDSNPRHLVLVFFNRKDQPFFFEFGKQRNKVYRLHGEYHYANMGPGVVVQQINVQCTGKDIKQAIKDCCTSDKPKRHNCIWWVHHIVYRLLTGSCHIHNYPKNKYDLDIVGLIQNERVV